MGNSADESPLKRLRSPDVKQDSSRGIGPIFSLVCGILLMMGAGLVYRFEPRSPSRTAVATEIQNAEAVNARALQSAREREARERAEKEQAAADAAAERAQRAQLLADAASEAKARTQREELARQRAALAEAERAAAQSEEAWKRFYKPSVECQDPAAVTRVECINEYIKAKRAFQSRVAAASN